MKRTIILAGYGQMGRAALPLLKASGWEFLGFADNDPAKWSISAQPASSDAAAPSAVDMPVEDDCPPSAIDIPAGADCPTFAADTPARADCPTFAADMPAGADCPTFAADMPARAGCPLSGNQTRVRVMSVGDAIACQSDAVLICPISRARAESLRTQLLSLGYEGRIFLLADFYDALDIRAASLQAMVRRLRRCRVAGAVAELGVYQGEFSALLSLLFPDRPLYLFDTFSGFDGRDTSLEQSRSFSFAKEGDFADTSAEAVLARLAYPKQAVIRKGYFPETAASLEDVRFALVSLDADLYAPTLAGLEFFYPRLNPGGAIVLHDYANERFHGVAQAVAAYEAQHGPLCLVPLADLHGSCIILKPFA